MEVTVDLNKMERIVSNTNNFYNSLVVKLLFEAVQCIVKPAGECCRCQLTSAWLNSRWQLCCNFGKMVPCVGQVSCTRLPPNFGVFNISQGWIP